MRPNSQRKELLPCPFCGATWDNGLALGYKGQPAQSWHVACTTCKTNGPDAWGAHVETANDAIDLWNKRPAGPDGVGQSVGEVYASAMNVARVDALEEAARLCDLLAGLSTQGWGRKMAFAARKCATEIRALKNAAPQGDCLRSGLAVGPDAPLAVAAPSQSAGAERAPMFTFKCVFCRTKNKTSNPPTDNMLDCSRCGFPTVQTLERVAA